MCVVDNKVINSFALFHSFARSRPSKRPKVQVYKLTRRSEKTGAREETVLKNLKLYLENQIISQENKLKDKVVHLQQEKLVLMSELQKKFRRLNPFSVTL